MTGIESEFLGIVICVAVAGGIIVLVFFFSACHKIDEIHAKLFPKEDKKP